MTVRAVQVAAAGKAWAELEESERLGIEAILVECARWADAEVNQREFGGRGPTKAECAEQVAGTAETPVTRGMRLGSAKHARAMQCVEEKLGAAYPGRFSQNQRYRLHPETRQLERITHEKELEMLRKGGGDLLGSVVPDVIIHTGNPLQVQWVYDFKFPCPEDNPTSWRRYPHGNPLKALHQGDAYHKVFGLQPSRVTPQGALQ
ncbi:hypothetical protein HPC49_40185 [Pyxidicoccus fallax]|uniref:Uncharacterized protein n=1 Tax=Pyxidicoccus fallax TaxID=394095 RepID=A0A848LU25_9BACT|nr:hypothetical protein [Pyxidicoccus fallax]NMO21102.1 hypothetical protein [Pyxidicoccus fallax]NPC84420.1 hypothetical protein [Pyxidicoccus fallax]